MGIVDTTILVCGLIWLVLYTISSRNILWCLLISYCLFQTAFSSNNSVFSVLVIGIQLLVPALVVANKLIKSQFKIRPHIDVFILFVFVVILYYMLPNGFIGSSDYGSHKVFMLFFHGFIPYFAIRCTEIDHNKIDNVLHISLAAGIITALRAMINIRGLTFRLEAGEAGVLVTARTLAIGILVVGVIILSKDRNLLKNKAYSYALMTFFSILIFFTGSRAALVYSLVTLVIVYLLFYSENIVYTFSGAIKITLLCIAIISLGVIIGTITESSAMNRILYAIPGIGKYFVSSHAANSDAGRIKIIQSTIELIKQNNYLGVGTGQFSAVSYLGYKLTYPHNIFLEILLENGIIGLVLLSLTQIIFIRALIKMKKTNSIYVVFVASLYVYTLLDSATSGDIGKNYQLWIAGSLLLNVFEMASNTVLEEQKAL